MHQNIQHTAQQKQAAVIGRRQWLQAAAALVVAGAARPAGATHIRTKFRKHIRLGIDARVYAQFPVAEAARRVKADGFRSVLWTNQFADVKFNPLEPDWSVAEKIVGAFEKEDVKIAALFGYYNLVDPDEKRRRQGEARMELLLRNWKRLGCPIVSTETGTFNAKSEWLESPENDTEEGYQKCRQALERWTRLAEQTGAVLTIECYWRNVIGSIERAERLLKEIHSPALKLVMDPCNFFRPQDLPQMKPLLKSMFERLGPQIAIAHAKDVKASPKGTDLPAAGKGVLDYPLFLQLLAELGRPMDLILEHLKLDEMVAARDLVLARVEKLP